MFHCALASVMLEVHDVHVCLYNIVFGDSSSRDVIMT